MIILTAQWHFTVGCACGLRWEVGIDAAEFAYGTLEFHRGHFHTSLEERTLPIHIWSYVSLFDQGTCLWSRIGTTAYLGWVSDADFVYGVTIGDARRLHQDLQLL